MLIRIRCCDKLSAGSNQLGAKKLTGLRQDFQGVSHGLKISPPHLTRINLIIVSRHKCTSLQPKEAFGVSGFS
jgi:hypothetical protein